MKIAIISDIHGNSWALYRVLKDIEDRRADLIVNLGDSLYGPLNPKETFEIIKSYHMISISGNQDRFITENTSKSNNNATLRFVMNNLNGEALSWLDSLPKTETLECGALLCHGTPNSDTVYLLEHLSENFVAVRNSETIEKLLQGTEQNIIFCGHSHTPRIVKTLRRLIINAGSVGLPAYADDLPIYHRMETFNNNAQYCIATIMDNEIQTELISIPYDYEKAVNTAIKNNRDDWAKWLKTGRV